jgi:uncharacterized protein (TIGR03437 family)
MRISIFAVAATLGTGMLCAQTLDTSGDSLLKGAYRFRHVAILNTDANDDPTEVAASFGVITFDGAGNYTLTGTYVDNVQTKGVQTAFPAGQGGRYAIGANGAGSVTNPFNSSDALIGAVAQGVFVASDTESQSGLETDIFVAIPAGTPPVNSGFTAPYWVGMLDFTAGLSLAEKNAMFKLTPNGQGAFGAISVNGFANNQGTKNLTQTVNGATYNFTGDGNGNLTIPLPSGVTSPNALFTGTKSMFVSADGGYVLGWTPSGYDIFFGVRAQSAPPSSSFAGVYFVSGLEDFAGSGADGFYGSLVANGLGSETLDQRVEFFGYYAYDYVCSSTVNFNLNGTGSVMSSPCPSYQYAFSDNGQGFVAIGEPGDFALMVGLHGQSVACSGVCINPTAIFNSASYAPLTAGVAPGELITMYVSGLPNVEQFCIGGQACTGILGGVQVFIDNIQAPIFSVSGSNGTVSAIVPYEINAQNQGVAHIQVNSGGVLSNVVTLYLGLAVPGVFTYSQNGLGQAIAEHASGAFVTTQNPAAPGETIVVVLTGAGAVTPSIANGAVPSLTTLSYADLFKLGSISFALNDYANGTSQPADATFLGLAPGFAAEYQLNVTVPKGVGPGNVYLELYDLGEAGFGFDVNQVQIPVGSAPAAGAVPAAKQPAATPLPRVNRGRRVEGTPSIRKPLL